MIVKADRTVTYGLYVEAQFPQLRNIVFADVCLGSRTVFFFTCGLVTCSVWFGSTGFCFSYCKYIFIIRVFIIDVCIATCLWYNFFFLVTIAAVLIYQIFQSLLHVLCSFVVNA